MPNRILYEKVCVSASLARLGAEEERLFYRLLVVCDDFGRFDARPAVLLGRCFPLMLDRVAEEDVAYWLGGLEAAGLVVLYAVEDRPYLQVVTWGSYQRLRAKRSKFPAPNGEHPTASADIRGHPHAIDSNSEHPRTSAAKCARARADSYSYSNAFNENRMREAGAAAAAPEAPARARASGEPADDDSGRSLSDAMDPATIDAAVSAWGAASDRLRGEMHARNYAAYIATCVPLGIAADGALLLSTANPLLLEQAARFRQQMLRALADIPDAPRDVRLVASP
jgi:hypothetical protein